MSKMYNSGLPLTFLCEVLFLGRFLLRRATSHRPVHPPLGAWVFLLEHGALEGVVTVAPRGSRPLLVAAALHLAPRLDVHLAPQLACYYGNSLGTRIPISANT